RLVVVDAADEGRFTVCRERELEAECARADLAAARELGPPLGPGGSGACKHPRRAGFGVVDVAADERECAVCRQGDGLAEPAVAPLVRGCELRAVLAPVRAGAGEDPCGAEIVVVLFGADERRVAVCGQRDAAAERARAAFVVGCQLLALLCPGRAC